MEPRTIDSRRSLCYPVVTDFGSTRKEASSLGNFLHLRQTALRLLNQPELSGSLYLAGGVLPWILSGEDSQRDHGDLDLVVEAGDLPAVRRYLCAAGYYRPELDSRSLPCNRKQEDYGLEAVINGIPVNFAPFTVENGGISQRNFALVSLTGFDALLLSRMEHLSKSDYVTTYPLPDGGFLPALTLEVVRATKECSDREKDHWDLLQLRSLPSDPERYLRVRPAVHQMQISYIAD